MFASVCVRCMLKLLKSVETLKTYKYLDIVVSRHDVSWGGYTFKNWSILQSDPYPFLELIQMCLNFCIRHLLLPRTTYMYPITLKFHQEQGIWRNGLWSGKNCGAPCTYQRPRNHKRSSLKKITYASNQAASSCISISFPDKLSFKNF